MVQSESTSTVSRPKRSFSVEFWVGFFALISFLCLGYLAVGLGSLELFGSNNYIVYAEFENIAGLKRGASVEIAGVQVGDVVDITLNQQNATAVLALKIYDGIKLHEDDIFSIRTKGVIGDRYVKISVGGSDTLVAPGQTLTETESVVDIEDIIGKVLHSFSGEGSEKDE